MQLNDIADGLRSRMPWPVAQTLLRTLGIKVGLGWDRTVTRLTRDGSIDQAKADKLQNALLEHILAGEKLSRLFYLGDDAIGTVRRRISNVTVGDNAYSKVFPLVLSPNKLQAAPKEQTLAAVVSFPEGLALVFCSARVLAKREQINLADLPESALKVLTRYDEIVGYLTTYFQACDVVWVPTTGGYVELRVDFPMGSPIDVAQGAMTRLALAFREVTQFELGLSPTNLFPLLDRLYEDETDAAVVELGFATTTGSVKHEKMRTRLSDLRREDYHVGGKRELGTPIDVHLIGVQWKRNLEGDLISTPELNLSCSVRGFDASTASVTTAVVRKCIGLNDYNFVRSRVLARLK